MQDLNEKAKTVVDDIIVQAQFRTRVALQKQTWKLQVILECDHESEKSTDPSWIT